VNGIIKLDDSRVTKDVDELLERSKSFKSVIKLVLSESFENSGMCFSDEIVVDDIKEMFLVIMNWLHLSLGDKVDDTFVAFGDFPIFVSEVLVQIVIIQSE